jgi:CRISPR-associated exonuclease Cas4
MYTEEDLLPLSGLQHLTFCERRWALIHLEQQWEDNLFTAEGELLHEKAHSAEVESRPEVLVRRTLPLHSFRLGLSGQADVVEFQPCAPEQPGIVMPRRRGLWRPYPIEYKRSRDRGGSAYRVQLCAQALCLEEMLEIPVECGAVFDGRAHRRVEVTFDTALRGQVEQAAARMHAIQQSRKTPPPVYEKKKCEACSMRPVCLPTVAGPASATRYLNRAVGANLRQSAAETTDGTEEANP